MNFGEAEIGGQFDDFGQALKVVACQDGVQAQLHFAAIFVARFTQQAHAFERPLECARHAAQRIVRMGVRPVQRSRKTVRAGGDEPLGALGVEHRAVGGDVGFHAQHRIAFDQVENIFSQRHLAAGKVDFDAARRQLFQHAGVLRNGELIGFVHFPIVAKRAAQIAARGDFDLRATNV